MNQFWPPWHHLELTMTRAATCRSNSTLALLLAVAIACAVLVVDAGCVLAPLPAGSRVRTANVLVVTLDGWRWQELFGGADRKLFSRRDQDGEGSATLRRFWRPSPAESRAAIMPFFWSEIAKRGQVFGNPESRSRAHVTNGLWFSYPGYAEMLSGVADSRVDSNDKKANPNLTVLEWLEQRPGFNGRVAAFGAWDLLPYILNVPRSGLPAGDGFPPAPSPRTDRERAINDLAADLPPLWEGAPLDAPIMQAALECVRTRRPRVLYVMLGETDEWAHEKRYDLYLDAAFRADRFIRRLWETVQSIGQYADRTALIVATDHGRGATAADWTDHGRKVPAAEETWIAVMGPDTAPLGDRAAVTVTTAQIAATVAALVGEDYRAGMPTAASFLPSVVAPSR